MQIYSKSKTKQVREASLAYSNILDMARLELSKKRLFRLQITGNSMNPSICDGDYVTVEQTSSQKIRPGDIVLLASMSNTALVHRVSKIEEKNGIAMVITRGDAANYQDTPIPSSNILGRVTLIERKDKLVNLNNPLTRLMSRFYGFINRLRNRKRD